MRELSLPLGELPGGTLQLRLSVPELELRIGAARVQLRPGGRKLLRRFLQFRPGVGKALLRRLPLSSQLLFSVFQLCPAS